MSTETLPIEALDETLDAALTSDATPDVDESTGENPTDTEAGAGESGSESTNAESKADANEVRWEFASEDEKAEHAKLQAEAENLLRSQADGVTERNFALGGTVWKLAHFEQCHAPKFEDEDLTRCCNRIWDKVALDTALPEKNFLMIAVAYFVFRDLCSKEFGGIDICAERKKGKPSPDRLPYTVFERHIYPIAIDFDKSKIAVEVKVKWLKWVGRLVTDIVSHGHRYSRNRLEEMVKAERHRQKTEGKSEAEIAKIEDGEKKTSRQKLRKGVKSSFDNAVKKAVKDELYTAKELADLLGTAMKDAEMDDVPVVGGVDPMTMRPDDAESLIAVLTHFKRVDVLLRLQSKASAAIAKIQG